MSIASTAPVLPATAPALPQTNYFMNIVPTAPAVAPTALVVRPDVPSDMNFSNHTHRVMRDHVINKGVKSNEIE